jgi:hypothetical protein
VPLPGQFVLAAGREHELARQRHRRARQDFVERWAKSVRKRGA